MLQVVGDEPGAAEDEEHDHHEQQEVVGEIGLEEGRVDLDEVLRALEHELEVLDPLGDVDPDEKDDGREE